MNKMNVVAFKSTSHVLGAAVRSTQPDKPFVVGDLAANGIMVRDSYNARLSALVDAAQLQIAVVDYDTRVFYRPQQFVVTDGRAEQQTEIAAVAALATLSVTQVTVTLPVKSPSDIEVFVHITGGVLQEPVIRAVPIARDAFAGSVGLVLGAGDYTMVIFAPGYVTVVKTEHVP